MDPIPLRGRRMGCQFGAKMEREIAGAIWKDSEEKKNICKKIEKKF
jgi:hypothetical protein